MAERRTPGVVAAYVVALLVAAFATRAPAAGGGADEPPAHVHLVIVDGLGADVATPERMPRLAAAVAAGGTWTTSTGVMPARTNPNHATLLTGALPAGHGITGNWYWSGSAERELDDPALLEMETLFTAVARQRPAWETAAAFGKKKLRTLFGPVTGRQRGPTHWWAPADPAAYGASDDETMAGYRDLIARAAPAFGVVALPGVDAAGHRDGPRAPSYAAAVDKVDGLIGALIDDLRRSGRWDDAVVIVTADHGFDALDADAESFVDAASVTVPGAHVVSDGGVAHVYAASPDALDASVAVAHGNPAIVAVYGRVSRPGVAAFPAAWGAIHPRMGDLVLVLRPGATFVAGTTDPTRRFHGNHGAPGQLGVPFVVVGGHARLRAAGAAPRPGSADVAPTVAALLGIGPPRRADGSALDATLAGHVLTVVVGEE